MNMPRRPTAVLADAKARPATDLAARLRVAWPELDIVGICHGGSDALEALNAHRPDIAFLDIRMPDLSGLDVAAAIGFPCHVVFVSACGQYALEAFERAATDYLLKPVDAERLAKTVSRLRTALAAPSRPPDAHPPLRWIRAAVGELIRLIDTDDVLYFQALNKHISVVTATEQAVIGTPIRKLLAQLDPGHFWQIHRSTIVNLRFVISAHTQKNGHLLLTLAGRDQQLHVSRSFAARFRRM